MSVNLVDISSLGFTLYFHRNKKFHSLEELKGYWASNGEHYRQSYNEYAKSEQGMQELALYGEQVVLPTRRYINRASV